MHSGMAIIPFFFLPFDDSFRFRVWIPSFFIVNGRLTCENGQIMNAEAQHNTVDKDDYEHAQMRAR